MNLHDIFSTRVRALRLEFGLTQKELANYLELSTAQISDMEKGKTLTSVERLVKLASFYQVTTDYLLGLSDNPKRDIPVSKSEIEILYDQLPDNQKHSVQGFISGLLQR